ncbi:MAG: sigma-70 family RNA polymerase sigma factor [Phycisphaerales bacterium]
MAPDTPTTPGDPAPRTPEGHPPQQVTLLLGAIADGDSRAARDLLPIVYEQLRALARAQMSREKPGMTLQPTALVHEAYLRLVGSSDIQWNSRGHFFGAAAQAMRRILVEAARTRKQVKRGGGRDRVELSEEVASSPDPNLIDHIALDDALTRLEQIDKRKSDVVMMRYFAGLSVEETAAALNVSTATVKNDWAYAKAWLYKEMNQGNEPGGAE